MKMFIDPKILPQSFDGSLQVLFLGLVYSFILYTASDLISEGSELLLLVPRYANIVGPVVLPILGALPDGAIVLFSGMGENAQKEVAVGLGTLAGSTVMLLTIPWAISIVCAVVPNNVKGKPNYNESKKKIRGMEKWNNSSALNSDYVKQSGFFIGVSSIGYIIVQGAATYCNWAGYSVEHRIETMRIYVLIGLGVTLSLFLYYIWMAVRNTSTGQDPVVQNRKTNQALKLLKTHMISMDVTLSMFMSESYPTDASMCLEQGIALTGQHSEKVKQLLGPVFDMIDYDHDKMVSFQEVEFIITYFSGSLSSTELRTAYDKFDADSSGLLDFSEFVSMIMYYVISTKGNIPEVVENENSDSSEAEILKSTSHLPPDQQQRRITYKAFSLLLMGTFLVLLFSEPMVDVLNDLGKRASVSPFYLAFIFAPLASNAAEAIASITLSSKRTAETFGVALSALTGAANMNNTFCLAVFLIIVYVKNLSWDFGPEIISILFVEFVMVIFSQWKTYNLFDACVITMLYPASLLLVSLLK